MRDTQREAPYREHDAGLDPRTPGSLPEPKADAQPLSHPGVPKLRWFQSQMGNIIIFSLP